MTACGQRAVNVRSGSGSRYIDGSRSIHWVMRLKWHFMDTGSGSDAYGSDIVQLPIFYLFKVNETPLWSLSPAVSCMLGGIRLRASRPGVGVEGESGEEVAAFWGEER